MDVINSISNNKAFKEFNKAQNKDFWKYKIDKSVPNHTFVKRVIQPEVQRQGNGVQTLRFTFPKDGMLGKMLLKLEDVDGITTFLDNAGMNICSEARLLNPFGIISRIFPEVIYQKIEEMQTENEYSLMRTLVGDNEQDDGQTASYCPLLFNFTESVNGFLDTVHDTPYQLEVDLTDSTSITSVHTNPVWRVQLICEYIVLPEPERLNLVKQYPLTKSIKNYIKEKEITTVSGTNRIQLKQKGLCSRIYVALKDTSTLDYDAMETVKITKNGQDVVDFDMLVENNYFSHNYLGNASNIFASPSTNIWSINFDISSRQNGFRGGVYLNENNNDNWTLEISTGAVGQLIVIEEMYELVRIDEKRGLMMVKAT